MKIISFFFIIFFLIFIIIVEHPLDPNSNNVEASLDLKPNIDESFIEVKPNDNEVSVDYKENFIKHNVTKLVDNEVDATKYFKKNVKYKVRDDLNNWVHQSINDQINIKY